MEKSSKELQAVLDRATINKQIKQLEITRLDAQLIIDTESTKRNVRDDADTIADKLVILERTKDINARSAGKELATVDANIVAFTAELNDLGGK
jgi:hypothetical protein